MNNPLIAQTQDSTKAYSGISLLETANDLSTAIQSGDWASVAMGAVGTALDALSMAMDPFGAILAAGVSWLMEHVGPLKDALNGLTGNADQIAAQSETWANVAKELGGISSDLNDAISADLQSWSGSASDAYRQRAQDLGTSLQAAQKGCEGASSADAQRGWVDTNFYAIVTDLVGSPQELVDDGGRVVWHARHTAWGAEPGAAVPAGPATTPLRFPGQYHDAETGLHYNFYRYYDPAQAHYLSRDPLGMRAGPNPRAYVPNPTTMLDPLGLFMCVQSEAEEVADIASRNNFPTAMASVLRPAGHDQNSVFYGFSGRGNHDIRTGRQGSYANQNRLNGRNPETHKLPGGTTQHPRLTQALNNVPPNRRAENLQHGGCAEMDAVNQALHDSRGRPLTGQALQNWLDDLNGGRMGIAGVDSKTGGLSDRQGRYFPPCTTCDHVLGQFGIRPSGHSDSTLPARPLPQAAPAPAPAPAPAAPAPAPAPAPTPTPAPAPAPSGPAPSSSTAPPKLGGHR